MRDVVQPVADIFLSQTLISPTTKSFCPEPLLQLDDGKSAFMFMACRGNSVDVYTDDWFSFAFITAEEACNELQATKVIPEYIWGAIIDTASLSDVYQALAHLEFVGGATYDIVEVTLTSLVVDRKGRIETALIRIAYLLEPGGEQCFWALSLYTELPVK